MDTQDKTDWVRKCSPVVMDNVDEIECFSDDEEFNRKHLYPRKCFAQQELINSIEQYGDVKFCTIGSARHREEYRITSKNLINMNINCKASRHKPMLKCKHGLCYDCHTKAYYAGHIVSGCEDHNIKLSRKLSSNLAIDMYEKWMHENRNKWGTIVRPRIVYKTK